MEIEFFGANCVRVRTKNASIVFDDNLSTLGAKTITKDQDALFYTNKNLVDESATAKARLLIDSPGEFEIGDVTVKSVHARAHIDEETAHTAAVFQCLHNNKTITILGHVHPDINDYVIELAGGTDVLVIPVGGNGYTLDSVGASNVIKKIEPEVIIPTQYDEKGLKFEVPAAPLDDFLNASGIKKSKETTDSYKIEKPDSELSGQTHIVVVKK